MKPRFRFLFGVLVLLVVAAGSHAQECGDLDDSGQIEATDALLLLNKAVDQPVPDLVCPVSAGLPATGQTTCYDAAGVVIECAGTGQDGEFQMGATRSFTDNGDGTITDNATGLMWEKLSDDGSIHQMDQFYSWTDAFSTKVTTLNATSFAGHSDWRVPNIVELASLQNFAMDRPAIYSVFHADCVNGCTVLTCSCTSWAGTDGSSETYYWASTAYAGGEWSAWSVSFHSGGFGVWLKTQYRSVRAVRGGL